MKHKFSKELPKIIVSVVGTVCLLAAFLLLINAWEQKRNNVNVPQIDRDSITYQGVKYTQRKDLETVLIMGLDKYEADQVSGQYLNYQQADFMLLMAVDRENKTYSVLHLNRDTMTDMSILGDRGERVGSINGQLALSHTYGTGGKDSCRNAAEAVSNLLHGVKIDHFLSVTMDAVAILNDLAGGVTVEILDDFSKVDPDLVQGEIMTLRGKQALTYVRTRKGLEDSSNLHRMERQRQYLTALREQMNKKSEADPQFLAKALSKVSEYLVSDITINQMAALSEHMEQYAFTGFKTIDGEAVVGEKYMEFYPNEIALIETVLELYFEPKK